MKKRLLVTTLAFLSILNIQAQSTKKALKNTANKLEILETISNYSYNWDEKKSEELANLFTKDGIWGWYRADGTKVVEMPSRAEFKGFAAQMFNEQLKSLQTRHFQTNTVFISLTETIAKTKTMYFASGIPLNGKVDMENLPFMAYQGVYEDEFVKDNGVWKFKVRKLITDN